MEEGNADWGEGETGSVYRWGWCFPTVLAIRAITVNTLFNPRRICFSGGREMEGLARGFQRA